MDLNYFTEPCEILYAIGNELGLTTRREVVASKIIQEHLNLFHNSSNCVWKINKIIHMLAAIKSGHLATITLISKVGKSPDDRPNRMEEIHKTFDLSDPKSLDRFKVYIESMREIYHVPIRNAIRKLRDL